MKIYKFKGNTTKLLKAYTKVEDGNNLPKSIEDKPIKWDFCEKIDITIQDFNKKWLKEIEKVGYYILYYSIEDSERVEKIPSDNYDNQNGIKFFNNKKNQQK